MSTRIYKVNELLKNEVGQIIAQEMDFEGVMTVTAVETTRDLRQATVWLGYFGSNAEEALAKIEQKRRDIQSQINHRLEMKHVPRLDFSLDHSGEYADKMNQLFKEAKDGDR